MWELTLRVCENGDVIPTGGVCGCLLKGTGARYFSHPGLDSSTIAFICPFCLWVVRINVKKSPTQCGGTGP